MLNFSIKMFLPRPPMLVVGTLHMRQDANVSMYQHDVWPELSLYQLYLPQAQAGGASGTRAIQLLQTRCHRESRLKQPLPRLSSTASGKHGSAFGARAGG
jgi:hypothetical protein